MDAAEKLRIEKMQAGWKYRAVDATEQDIRLRMILLAMLGRPPVNPPWFGPSCVITADGLVLTNFVDGNQVMHEAWYVCTVDDLVTNFRKLADHLRLNDTDRESMFGELRKWVSKDYRADPDWKELRQMALLN